MFAYSQVVGGGQESRAARARVGFRPLQRRMAVYGFGSNLFGNCVPPAVSTALEVLTPTLVPDATCVLAASFSQTVLRASLAAFPTRPAAN